MARPQPEPYATTNRPPTDEPMIIAALAPSRLMALAGTRNSAGTVWGVRAELAGNVNAAAMPLTAAKTINRVTVAVWVSISVAALAWLMPAARAATTITRWRGQRSATMPPNSRN